jgi:hypothetical protein
MSVTFFLVKREDSLAKSLPWDMDLNITNYNARAFLKEINRPEIEWTDLSGIWREGELEIILKEFKAILLFEDGIRRLVEYPSEVGIVYHIGRNEQYVRRKLQEFIDLIKTAQALRCHIAFY